MTPALLKRLPAEGIADKELSALLARDRLAPIVHETTYEALREVSPLLGSRWSDIPYLIASAPMETVTGRQISVAGMAYAPTSEQGVVLLFGRLAPTLGFCVEKVQIRCPDCTARRRGKLLRIEFEFWASDYARHGHPPHAADIIVCWENDWESRPRAFKHMEIIDLKRFTGALPRVFVTGCSVHKNERLLKARFIEWNVPLSTQIGDLVLMYRSTNKHAIHDAWKVIGPFTTFGKRNKEGRWPGLQVGMRRLVTFTRPVTYTDFRNDPSTRELGVVISRFRGKQDITDGWPLICDKITRLNPKAKKSLAKYRFDDK